MSATGRPSTTAPPCTRARGPLPAARPRPAAVFAVVLLMVALSGCGPAPRGVPLAIRSAEGGPTAGPLAVLRANPRYFTDAAGRRAVYLTGSHTWNTFQDWGPEDPPRAFDYDGYLDFLVSHGHNFLRLYVWEQAAWFPGNERTVWIAPLPYLRTGPGLALDGHPRFDLSRFDPAYFARLRARVAAARARGIYVSVMLFDGWSMGAKGEPTGNPWRGHPFHRDNNVNGIDGDRDGDGEGGEAHTLANPAVTALQKRYVAQVVAAVGDLDNVLYEISNESEPRAYAWQVEMIRTVRALESARGVAHPVGMTAPYPPDPRGNAPLFASTADWIAPRDDGRAAYRHDPPAPRQGDPVVISDTDHLWGVGGRPDWVWRSLLRGVNPIFMDPYQTHLHHLLPWWPESLDVAPGVTPPVSPEWEGVRTAMGLARAVADRVDLAALRPMGELASSRYCLASPGREYLAYLPRRSGRLQRLAERVLGRFAAGRLVVDLAAVRGPLDVEWLDTRHGLVYTGGAVAGGGRRALRAPFPGEAVLHLARHGAPGALAGAGPDPRAAGRPGR